MNNRAVIFFGFLVAALWAANTDLTSTRDLYVKRRAIVGIDSILPNVGLDVSPFGMTGLTQIGEYVNPTCNSAADAGCIGLKVKPKIAANSGRVSNATGISIDNASIGSASEVNWLRGIHIGYLYGADSGVYSIDIDRGKFRNQDSSQLNGLVTFGAGIELHGRLVDTTRIPKFGDTDCVILFNISAGDVHDTLPSLYTSIGRVMHFTQAQASSAGKFCLHAVATQRIDDQDSICIRSALGISRMSVFNQGDKWIITDYYEKGFFAGTIIGTNIPRAADTGWYVIQNDMVHVRVKPLLDTSNANYLNITGLSSFFTEAGLDSTYSATSAAILVDSGVTTSGLCVLSANGSGVTCARYDLAPFKTSGIKGLPYGVEFNFTLPRKAVH